MNSRHARCWLAVPAGILAALLGVTTAVAATTWTVRPGGPVSLKSGLLALDDRATGTMLTCTSAKMSGTLKSGSGLPGAGIGSLTAVSVSGCSPAGMTFAVTAAGLPWQVSFSSYDAANGVVTGRASHVRFRVKSVSGLVGCHAVIDGTSGTASDGVVKFTYTDRTAVLRTLTTGGNLHYYSVIGCDGLFHTGDPVAAGAAFTVSPEQAITSP